MTSNFSGMQSGTGLLLDLGRSDSMAEVSVLLGSASGGTIQLRAGDSADARGAARCGSARTPAAP